MKDIHDQYASLFRDYAALMDDYQDIREDTKLLDWVEKHQASIHYSGGWHERIPETRDDTESLEVKVERLWLPWRVSAYSTMGPPCATIREAIDGLRTALDA